jgi:hypothetical protein
MRRGLQRRKAGRGSPGYPELIKWYGQGFISRATKISYGDNSMNKQKTFDSKELYTRAPVGSSFLGGKG